MRLMLGFAWSIVWTAARPIDGVKKSCPSATMLDRRMAGDRAVKRLAQRHVQGRRLDVVEVADVARVQVVRRACLKRQLAELLADLVGTNTTLPERPATWGLSVLRFGPRS